MATGRPVTSAPNAIPVTDTPGAEPVIDVKGAEPVTIVPSGGYPLTFVVPGLSNRAFNTGFSSGYS